MGFSYALPAPNGIESWQNNEANLNAVMARLNAGRINDLKFGDKILVEPLWDVRLQSVWHSLTVTQIALYGKWILGVDSNGGSSGNSGSWGFISEFTNRLFPNALYTPDGQGLWAGVGAIAPNARGTFFNLINQGYGVGIAYSESRPDFTPVLSARVCERR